MEGAGVRRLSLVSHTNRVSSCQSLQDNTAERFKRLPFEKSSAQTTLDKIHKEGTRGDFGA